MDGFGKKLNVREINEGENHRRVIKQYFCPHLISAHRIVQQEIKDIQHSTVSICVYMIIIIMGCLHDKSQSVSERHMYIGM